MPDAFVGGPVQPGAALYSLEGDFGFSPPNSDDPATEIGHEIKLINFNQLPDTPLALKIQRFAHNTPPFVQAFTQDNINGFNRPTNLRFGPDGCAYVVDYGAVRDLSDDSHFVGAGQWPARPDPRHRRGLEDLPIAIADEHGELGAATAAPFFVRNERELFRVLIWAEILGPHLKV